MSRRHRLDPAATDSEQRWDAADPLSLADAVAATVGRRGWHQRLEGARIHQHWRDIAGEQLAAHTEPVRLRNGVLVLRADSPVWATQVRYFTTELAARANAFLGPDQVCKVSVTTGALKGTAS